MITTVEQELRIFEIIKGIRTADLVSVCGWCPDAKQRTAALVAQGKKVSHGMCTACAVKMEAELGS